MANRRGHRTSRYQRALAAARKEILALYPESEYMHGGWHGPNWREAQALWDQRRAEAEPLFGVYD